MSSPRQRPSRRDRRRARRLRAKPERVAAVGSLAAVVALLGLIVLTSGSGSSSHPSGASANAKSTASSQSAARPGTAPVPILVYHVINSRPPQSTAPDALYVPTDEFSGQMQALKANGWHAVTLDQVQAYWTRGVSLGPGQPIVLTFDTGYASQYTNALPVLKGLGWRGVEDLPLTGLSPSDGGMTDAQIRGLTAAGWELDTQGATDTDLTAVDPGQLSTDVASARQTLRQRYGAPVNWFSYPLGDYNTSVIAAVRAAGFVGATTVNPGWASPQQDRFRLPRVVVSGGTTPSQLLSQIAAAKSNTSVPSSYTGQGLA